MTSSGRTGRLLAGRLAIALASLLLVATTPGRARAYENDTPCDGKGPHGGGAHRAINDAALAKFVQAARTDDLLRRYDFAPTVEGYGLPPETGLFFADGDTVTRSGSWYRDEPIWPGVTATFIEEGAVSAPFPWWVREGGYTADEPESYMALRHFYDPRSQALDLETRASVAYLTDVEYPAVARTFLGHNPHMDARAWALSGSRYAWRVGASALDAAQTATDPATRRRHYGRAWRALGEAMHVLADMTLPAHVRNDSHPGGYAAWFSGRMYADPYEAWVTGDIVARRAEAEPPRELRRLVERARTPSALFFEVASFTQRRHLSRDTIVGTDAVTGTRVEPRNGQPAYPAPTLDDLRYRGEPGRTGFYVGTDGTERLTRRPDGTLEFSTEAREAQADELVPSAIEACARLIEMYVPRYRVEIEGLDDTGTMLRVRATRLREGDDGKTTEDPIPSDPSSSPWAVLFVDARGQRRTVAVPTTPAWGGVRVPVADGLAGLTPPTGEARAPTVAFVVGLDVGGILVRSAPLRTAWPGRAPPPPEDPRPSSRPPTLPPPPPPPPAPPPPEPPGRTSRPEADDATARGERILASLLVALRRKAARDSDARTTYRLEIVVPLRYERGDIVGAYRYVGHQDGSPEWYSLEWGDAQRPARIPVGDVVKLHAAKDPDLRWD